MTSATQGIRLDEVQVRYGSTCALHPCSLSFSAGKPCLLLGGNGAGKTTLLRVLASCLRPSRGTLEHVPGAPAPGETAYLGADLYLYDRFTVKEMVQLYQRFANVVGVDCSTQLRHWKLEDRQDQQVGTLSRGQQMRLALACCTIREPRFQFFDEPTSVLDDASVDLFASYVQGRPDVVTVIASHDVERLLPHVGRVVLLHEGAVLADATTDTEACGELIQRYRETNR